MKIVSILILLVFFGLNEGGKLIKNKNVDKVIDSNYNGNQLGGIDLPSSGNMNVLFIFVQFPDDNYQPENPAWPKGGLPINYNTWIDSAWTSNATPYSMTDYFNQMSLNRFHFTGKKISLITPHPRWWYIKYKKSRGFIHREIIKQFDSSMDFAQFDNWKKIKNYKHLNTSDKKLDWVCFIWRNISNEYPEKKVKSSDTTSKFINNILNMGWFGDTGLGLVPVDEGARFVTGAGATIAGYFKKDAFRFSIHELAHYLLGGNEMHNGSGFWAMLSGYEVRSFMINSYERYRLGWCDLVKIDNTTQTITNAALPDFITTGIAYRIEINKDSSQYFYIENHQRISRWDECSINDTSEKGIYVLRQDGASSPDGMSAKWIQMIPAEGRFDWSVHEKAYPDYYTSGLPVFEKDEADRNGYHSLEYVPYIYEGKNYRPNEIIFLKDSLTGKVIEHPTRYGDGKDAFRIGYNEVFSPWSNPNSQKADGSPSGIGFKINYLINGTYSLDIYINTAESAPPSKPINYKVVIKGTHPVLKWSANIEPDLKGYYVFKKISKGNNTDMDYIFTTSTIFTDNEFNITGSNDEIAEYWIVAVDNDNNFSVNSDQFFTKGINIKH